MSIELKVPAIGESINETVIGEWLKKEGDWVDQDEPMVIIETDKVNVELPAPEAGVLSKILKGEGEDAAIGEVIGYLEPGKKPATADTGSAAQSEGTKPTKPTTPTNQEDTTKVMPAARRALADAGLKASQVQPSGPGGRLLKEDVIRHGERTPEPEGKAGPTPQSTAPQSTTPQPTATSAPSLGSGARQEEVVKMTPLRRRVAERLVEAQNNAALLTTFNEVDMSRVIALRKEYQESFVKKYDIKLGFMSFFVKAAIEALKEVPQVNAEVRGQSMVFRNYQDIGIAVGGGKGLVVPIIRNAERLSFAEVELAIANYAHRAKKNQLKLEELQGGTFTISNGGIYGSLLSTPIVNPPQSGILGLHKIEERPIALNGEVVIRPMMYLALSYDHRIVDGREAVTFLVRIKERIEDPTRILLEV
jgi:2-oxoglutarate dehydrogenase E2 component (dihydrolipoamide succinyltransferase)